MSRITHRKGLDEDLPQLAGAELGWVLDNRKLYIGNGEIVEGAPVVGNTEILTEFSDILGLASTYTYKGDAAGYVVETGLASTSVLRSMQSKFDDFASVKDFGAFGDDDGLGNGSDDTDAINRALNELFCHIDPPSDLTLNSENNVRARRSLYFPAGIYKVTGKIKVPPHAKLWGEGLTSSVIKFFRADDISVTEMIDGERYQVSLEGDSGFGAVDSIFVANGPGTGTTLVRDLPSVVETADSLQNAGLQLGQNGEQNPTGIEMVAMSIQSTEENSLLKLNSVTRSGFNYLGLHGPNTFNPLTDTEGTSSATAAVEVAGTVFDVTVNKLTTSNTTYGLRADGDTKGLVLENSGLNLHFKGVYVTNPLIESTAMVLGERYKIVVVGAGDFRTVGSEFNREGETFIYDGSFTLAGGGKVIDMADAGPTGVVVSRNIMDNIARQGVHYENVLFNSTGYNVFYNVGNNLDASSTPTAVAPVIHFETDQCISVGDLFEREDESIHPRIKLDGNGGVMIDGSHSIHLGAYERQVGIVATLDAATTDETVFSFTENEVNSYRVDYSITRTIAGSDETRMGRLYVSNNGGTITYNDEYTESLDTGITLDVTSLGANTTSEVQFTSNAGDPALMSFSVVRLE